MIVALGKVREQCRKNGCGGLDVAFEEVPAEHSWVVLRERAAPGPRERKKGEPADRDSPLLG